MKKRTLAPVLLSLLSGPILAQPHSTHLEHHIEEIIVTATPFRDEIAETMLPVNVVTGEELRRKVGHSLGETLKNETGIHSASFGTGVGQPVIRGQSGNRVQVLQSGVEVTDAAAISPDHANGVEPLLADRIEVLRGPSTLLYGNGAIGGVVNVVDRRIPQTLKSEHRFIGEQAYDSVSDENRTLIRFDGAAGSLGFHLDGVTRSGNNVDIPGFANLDPAAGDNTFGFIENSFSESESLHFGTSFIGEQGFMGFSVGRITSQYGLPPGVHSHHHEEDHEGDEDEHHEDETHESEHHDDDDEEGHSDAGDVAIRLDLEQIRYDLKAHYDFRSGFLQTFEAHLGFADYEHTEIEIQEREREIGTTYTNRGFDSRFTVSHRPVGNWTGIAGIQVSRTEFAAVGEEAYIDPADIDAGAIFLVERLDGDRLDWELGARMERQQIDPAGDCSSSESTMSLSASARYVFLESSSLLAAVSRSERAPTVEELYSNITGAGCTRPADDGGLVLHAATDLLELGNPELDVETANNIELGLRHEIGAVSGRFSAFYNAIDSYIYLEESGAIGEQVLAVYRSRDATFRGIELSLEAPLATTNSGAFDARFFSDVVRAEFDGGANVPRIPPVRFGVELEFTSPNASAGLSFVRALDQNRVGSEETSTPGYARVGAHADYTWQLTGGELMVFVRADNLLDEDIRNHVSLLKEAVPEPGRSVRVGLRLTLDQATF
ncbi:MAG: TonB-dependent receptor [Proteobacteria bacterium]|nr:TonB-dependent receptor [Pseudomonadota bacterium]MDA1301096.1 TonB-dependent receptor [Pseudomonadota bacterium]